PPRNAQTSDRAWNLQGQVRVYRSGGSLRGEGKRGKRSVLAWHRALRNVGRRAPLRETCRCGGLCAKHSHGNAAQADADSSTASRDRRTHALEAARSTLSLRRGG